MLSMQTVHIIRHKVLVEGLGIQHVAQELGRSRTTVYKYLAVSTPGRAGATPRRHPVLDAVSARIDTLVAEWQVRTTAKQRLTAARLHRQLRTEGYTVSDRSVRQYLRQRKLQAAEVFVPLSYRPGELAEVDFFDIVVEERGQQRHAWKFLMHLMYSGYDFVWLYDRCDQLAFLDAHVRAFAYFGGVPQRLAYANLTPAVRKIVGSARVLTERFAALAAHYLFEPCFARPGEGHDKGGVESRGKAIRLQHLTPIPRWGHPEGDRGGDADGGRVAQPDQGPSHRADGMGALPGGAPPLPGPASRGVRRLTHPESAGEQPCHGADRGGQVLCSVHVGGADHHGLDWGGCQAGWPPSWPMAKRRSRQR
jgi:transposase